MNDIIALGAIVCAVLYMYVSVIFHHILVM